VRGECDSGSAALSVRGLRVRHEDVSGESFEARLDMLELAPCMRVALAGPSGSGKSTLLDALGMLRAPTALGRYELRDASGSTVDLTGPLLAGDIEALSTMRARSLGYVLQQGGLLPFLTVRENIALGGGGGASAERIAALMQRLGLAELGDRLPAALSIGQRQRVSVARALVGGPSLILADEPTSSLDPPRAREVLRLFLSEAEATGAALIVASHHWELLDEFGFDRLSPVVTRSDAETIAAFELRPFEAGELAS
jgi:putative ABC transport system ATP-binding protein